MRGKRLIDQMKSCLINNPYKRAEWLRKNHVFIHIGENVSYQPRKLPLYGQLISIGKNVVIGSNVTFCTHDGYSEVCNRAYPDEYVNEKVGCIKIGSNCFIGANVNLLYDIEIGDDSVIAAGATITKDVPSGEVWGGVPGHCIGYTKKLRGQYQSNPIIHVENESLSEATVQALWHLFEEKRK